MHTFSILLFGMGLGIATLYLANYIISMLNTRLNYGQKVRFEGKVVGHVVVCRYNGMKKYFYTTENLGSLNNVSFYERADAIKACRQEHLDHMLKQQASRPKQTSFPR